MLRLFQGAMHGPMHEGENNPAHGFALRANELAALLPLVVFIVWIGIAPNGWLHPMAPVAQTIVTAVSGGK
jgi:NADH:ubiquinone oxidoreductase subunit 4 (subunit M)